MFHLRTIVLGAVLATAGCGEEPDPNQRAVYPAGGSVTFRGNPIPDATVRLHPVAEPDDGIPIYIPRGRVDETGTYQVTTYRQADGAPAGEYLVSLSWQGPLKGVSEEQEDRMRERLPRKFTHPRTSGIRVIIEEGENRLPPIAIQ